MSVKLRLLRKGRKRHPFYYIVAADSRAPRDGRFIERVGSYDPNTNPATIDLDLNRSVEWLQNGAQPTDTVRAILSYKGAMHKYHLLRGAAKGAFPEEEVEGRFTKWLDEKENRIQSKRDKLAEESASTAKERMEAETKIREARAAAILAKNSPLAEEAAEESGIEEAPAVEAAAETTEAPAAEETPAIKEAPEAPAEEAAPEAEAKTEEPEAKEEAPAEEDKDKEKAGE